MRTTADERLIEAKEHVELALQALNDILVNRVVGSGDFSLAYWDTMVKCHYLLLQTRKDLGD